MLGIEVFDKKLKSCKPIVVLQKLKVADIVENTGTFSGQIVPLNIKELETQKNGNSELSLTMSECNEPLSKNIFFSKSLIDAKQTKMNDVTEPVIETSYLCGELPVMNPDMAVFTSDISKFATRKKISCENNTEALMGSKHSDVTLIVSDTSEEALTVSEYVDEALLVPAPIEEAPTVPEHSNKARTVSELSDEAPAVPDYSDEVLTVLDPSEALTIPERSDETPTVPEPSTVPEPCDEAPIALENSEEAQIVPQPCEEALSVPEYIDRAPTVPEQNDVTIAEHSDRALTVSKHSDETLTVTKHSYEALTVSEHSDEVLTVFKHSDEALTASEHSNEVLIVPEYSEESLTVSEHNKKPFIIPEHSEEALGVLEHSEEALKVLELSEEVLTVFEHSDKVITVPEHCEEALEVHEHSEEALEVLQHSDKVPTVSEHNDEVLKISEHTDGALTVSEASNEDLTVAEYNDEAQSVTGLREEAQSFFELGNEALPVLGNIDDPQPVSEHGDETQPVSEHSDEALPISEHSGEAQLVSGHNAEAQPVSEQSDEAQPVFEHSDEAQPVSEHNDEAQPVFEYSDEAQPIFEHSDEALPISDHSVEAQLVSGQSDEARPVPNHSDHAPVVSAMDLIDDCLDAGVMTSPEWTKVSVTRPDQTGRSFVDVGRKNKMLMPGSSLKNTLVGAEQDQVATMTVQSAKEVVFNEQTSLSLLSHEQGKKVLLTSKQTCVVTPIVHEFNNTAMLASEQTDVAEVVPGVTAEPVGDFCFTDQTDDSMTDMDLVYQKLRIGQIGKASSDKSKTLLVSNIHAKVSNEIDEIGSEQFGRKSSIVHASGPLKMTIDTNDYCSFKNDLASKFEETLATIENSGSIDEIKITILKNKHLQHTAQSLTTQNHQDSFTTTPEKQLSAHGAEEKIIMIDDSVVFDDGPTIKPQIAITESPSTEVQDSKLGQNLSEKDEVIITSGPNKEEIPLDCAQNMDNHLIKEPKRKTCIVDYDEEEVGEGSPGKSGVGFQELVKYDISDDDYFEGSNSDNEEEEKKSENPFATITEQLQDYNDAAADDSSNNSEKCCAEEIESLVSESTEETRESNFTIKDLQDDDSPQIKSEQVEVLEGMLNESPESGRQSGLSNPAQHEPDSSPSVAVEPVPNRNMEKDQLQDVSSFVEGAPHFYLVGDDLVSTVAANIATSWSNNITVLTGEKLTLSEVPALLKERVSLQHLNQQQPVYFVCFVGLYNFIQLEARDCVKNDSPKCRCQMITLPVTSRVEAEAQLRSRVAHIKQELSKLVAGEHYLIIPDIQLIDLSRYQKYLDRVHKEVFDHELKHSELTKRINQKIAIDLVGIIVYLNEIIRDSYAFVGKKLPWLLSLWQTEKPFNWNKLCQIPVTNGYLLTNSATKIVADCITVLLDEYTKRDVPTTLERVYFIGDPRLSSLTPHWPVNGVEIATINDGNLVPSMVVQTIKNKCQNLDRCLIVICFSIKSNVLIKSISNCEGHDPCKYIVYQDTNETEVERKTLDIIETICEDVKNSSLTCEIALSPILPVNYSKYRSIIEMRHLKNTGHSITGQLPDPDASNKETCQMARHIDVARSVMTTEMKQRDFSVLDIPSCILETDVIYSTTQLVNGMSLTTGMAQKIVGIAQALINLLNNMREERKMNSKLAKYKLLRDSGGNSLNQAGEELSMGGGHPDRSRVEDLSNKLHGVSQPLESLDTVNKDTELPNRQQDLRRMNRPRDKDRNDSSFPNHSSISSKLMSRHAGSRCSPDSRIISSTSRRSFSPKRGKSRSPRRNESRLAPRKDRRYGRDRTQSPRRERSRSPRRQRYWSSKRVRSRSPRRDRSFLPRETRDRYSKRGRSRSKSIDRRSRSKRSSSRSSRHDRNRHHKRERSKSRSRSHSRRQKRKLLSSPRQSGPEVVNEEYFSKIYDEHVASFQSFLVKPETHPDYENWLKRQELTTSHRLNYAHRTRLNWECRINELMNTAWNNIKKQYSVKPTNKRHSRSNSSSSASSSSSGSAKKRSTELQKITKRSESKAASLKLSEAASTEQDGRKSKSARTSALSVIVDSYVSQLPSQPSTSKDADTFCKETPQSKSDSITWISKSFVEVSQKHDREPSTQLADASYIPRSSEIVPNYLSQSVDQPSLRYPMTLDYADHGPAAQLSRCRPSEPEVSSTSDRTSARTLKVIEILKLLVQVKGKAGVVGETLPLVLNRVQSARDRGVREISCFNSDDVILLGLIKNRLCQTSQEPHVSFIEKVIIDEAVSQLNTLLEMVQDALDNPTTFFDIDVLSRVTEKCSISESMAYIKNLLGEFKRSNSEDDVLPVFVDLVKMRGTL